MMKKELSCGTRENDGPETPVNVTLWTPRNRVCRRQTPSLTQAPDASKFLPWTLDAYHDYIPRTSDAKPIPLPQLSMSVC